MRIVLATLVTLLAFALTNHTPPQFDIVIVNGRVVDGTGNPWFESDVAIKDGRVVAMGRFDREAAARVIDAKGMTVAPGFIDVHTHVEGGIEANPTADN